MHGPCELCSWLEDRALREEHGLRRRLFRVPGQVERRLREEGEVEEGQLVGFGLRHCMGTAHQGMAAKDDARSL